MPVYYLIVGNRIKQEIDTADGDVTALPILDSARAVSLLNRQHVIALMNNEGWTAQQVIDKLGLVDEREV
jgi:hypothetical protein